MMRAQPSAIIQMVGIAAHTQTLELILNLRDVVFLILDASHECAHQVMARVYLELDSIEVVTI